MSLVLLWVLISNYFPSDSFDNHLFRNCDCFLIGAWTTGGTQGEHCCWRISNTQRPSFTMGKSCKSNCRQGGWNSIHGARKKQASSFGYKDLNPWPSALHWYLLTWALSPMKDKLKVWIYSFLQKVKKGNDKVEIEKFLFNFFKNIKRKLIVQDQVIFAEFFSHIEWIKSSFCSKWSNENFIIGCYIPGFRHLRKKWPWCNVGMVQMRLAIISCFPCTCTKTSQPTGSLPVRILLLF